MATQEEFRALIKVVADTKGADQVQGAMQAVRKEAEKPSRGFLKSVGLSSEDLVRSGLALVGLSAGLNIAATAADKVHDAVAGGIGAQLDAARTARAVSAAYGDQAGAFTAWAAQLGAATGNTRESVLAAALSARTLSQNYGLSIAQTQRLIAVSTDLAKVRGIDLFETFDRIQNAIRGEAEASEYLGLTLNDTFLKTRGLTETMSDAEKAQIRFSEVLRQSAQFSGLALQANTGLEGSLNRLNLQGAELAKTFGSTVGPTVQWVADRLTEAGHSAELLLKIGRVAQAQSITRANAIDQAEREIPLPAGIIGASQEGVERHARVLARAEEIYAESVGKATQEALGQVEIARKSVAEFDRLESELLATSAAQERLNQIAASKALAGLAADAAKFADQAGRMAQAADAIGAIGTVTGQLRTLSGALSIDRGDIDRLAQFNAEAALLGERQRQIALGAPGLREAIQQALAAQKGGGPDLRDSSDLRAQLGFLDAETARQRDLLGIEQERARLQQTTVEQVLAEVRARQQLIPASRAVEDIQSKQEELGLIAASTRGPERSAARQALRASLRSHELEQAQLAALRAGRPLTAAQRAAEDAGLTRQVGEANLNTRAANLPPPTVLSNITIAPSPTVRLQLEITQPDGSVDVWDQMVDASRGLGKIRIQSR